MARPLVPKSLDEIAGKEKAAALAGLKLLQSTLAQYGAPPLEVLDTWRGGGHRGLDAGEVGRLIRRLEL